MWKRVTSLEAAAALAPMGLQVPGIATVPSPENKHAGCPGVMSFDAATHGNHSMLEAGAAKPRS